MMPFRAIVVVAALFAAIPTPASAQSEAIDSTAAAILMRIHYRPWRSFGIGPRLELGRLIDETPLTLTGYLTIAFRSRTFEFETGVGWVAYGEGEEHRADPILTFRPRVNNDYVYLLFVVDYQIATDRLHWFAQAQYKLLRWLGIGFDGGGHGKLEDLDSLDNRLGGGGALHFNRCFWLDLAVHVNKKRPGFAIRLNFDFP